MMGLDILQLSSEKEDESVNSWVWISGENYRSKINEIVQNIVKRQNISKPVLIQKLAKKLHISVGPLNRIIYGKNHKISIPILIALIKYCNFKQNSPKYFIKNATHIFTSRQKEVIAIKNISVELAEIMGAFAADGNLTVLIRIYSQNKSILEQILNRYDLKLKIQKDRDKFFIRTSKLKFKELERIKKNFRILYSLTYLFEIIDSDKVAVKSIAKKIEKLFGIKCKINKKKGAWSFRIYNKIFARYFRLLGFSYGRKTEIVKEPIIIKKNPLIIRQAFARGVITFDGSVKYSGEISMLLKSKMLILDVSKILSNLKINNRILEKALSSTITIDKDNKSVLSLFLPYTKKWHRINNYLYGFKKRISSFKETIYILDEAYDQYNRKSISFNEIISFLQVNKEFTSKEIKNIFTNTNSGLYTKLRMLGQMNIINIKKILKRDVKGRFIEKYSKYYFNDNLNEWRLPNF